MSAYRVEQVWRARRQRVAALHLVTRVAGEAAPRADAGRPLRPVSSAQACGAALWRDGLRVGPAALRAGPRRLHRYSYVIQFADETYSTIANETYQGLATCQALMTQNAGHDSMDLYPNISLHVPLRCACPSAAQAAAGVRYLVTYILGWDDDSNTVADRFRADYQAVLDANSLSDNSTVYPFTTMLVPLKDPPKPDVTVLPEAPAPAPAPEVSDKPATSPSITSQSGGVKWRVMLGVGFGCGTLVSGALIALFLLGRCFRRRRGDRSRKAATNVSPSVESGLAAGMEGSKAAATPSWMTPTMAVSVDARDAVASLTVYEYDVLERATAGFAEENRVGNSSVYRAVIDGEAAAVKRVEGDVGAAVCVLGRVNHSCLVRLSGLCVHRGDTHLVFELAENGALSDWLHGGGHVLGWRQRMQVALDVADGLNYLHNYTSPPCVHRNLKSSNVLLDSCLRAKVSNFGLARAGTAAGGAQMTRHIVGTEGYLAPEYLEHGLAGPHLDVFAFGVVVLELLSGKEAAPGRVINEVVSDKNGEALLLWQEAERLVINGGDGVRDKVAAFVDARLREDYPLDVAFALLALALRCVAREPRLRPSMGEVFLSLSAVCGSTFQCDIPYGGDSGSTVSG